MQTTLRINDETYRRAKAKSGELGISLTRFFEEAVEQRLMALEHRGSKRLNLPVCSVSGDRLSESELRRRITAADLGLDAGKGRAHGSSGQ